MVMSILAIGILGMVAYTWMTRGFLSSLLNLLCTVVAGAIAFAVWEYVGYFLVEQSPTRGFTNFIGAMAWSLALGGTFAVTLGILRLVTDSIVRNNAPAGKMGDYIGGGICGVFSGLIVSGITIMSIGMLRLDTELVGYNAMAYKQGNVVRDHALWVPTDSLTAGFYGHLSRCAFASDTDRTLAGEYPNLADLPSTMRMTAGDGFARNWMAPDGVKLESRFSVGEGGKLKLADLLIHHWADKTGTIHKEDAQKVLDVDGKAPEEGASIQGFILAFNAGAKESTAQLVIGNAQVRLTIANDEGEVRDLYPIAAVIKADAAALQFARFRFDSEKLFITSAGADASPKFGFEFLVPQGFTPRALFVKNIRVDVSGETPKPRLFATPRDRDNAIVDGSLMGQSTSQSLSGSAAATSSSSGDSSAAVAVAAGQGGIPNGVRVSNQLPFVIQRGSEQGLELVEDKKNTIRAGEMKLDQGMLRQGQNADNALRIDRLEASGDVGIVQLDVGPSAATSLLGKSAAMAEDVAPPFLVDTNGTTYQAVGYIYQDGDIAALRYTPDDPIRGRSQLPVSLTRSRNDQKASFIFRVSAGVKIAQFRLGNKVVATFTPFLVDKSR
ncbi:MAG: CvpA family protein [Planctomycetota bacterium]|nr:CvpA family protein [Planctomycetota bacterium]